jgi:hypothetical protein
VYSVPWSPITDGERVALAGFIPGREMPLAIPVQNANAGYVDVPNPNGLPLDSLERLSLWIAQGATVFNCP